jgi:allantoinase
LPFLPDLVVRSRSVVTPGSTRAASVHIRGGKIAGVLAFDDVPPGCPLDDAGDAAVIPGVVDTNVQVSEPGVSGWERFENTTRAAAAGGVTTIIDMPPNRIPATTSADAVNAKRGAAEGKCHVDVGFWGALSSTNERDLAPMREAGVFGFKCWLAASGAEECPPVSEAHLRVAMPVIARLGLPLLVHAELPGPIDAALARRVDDGFLGRFSPAAHRARRRYRTYLESRPKAAENEAIALMIALCREFRTPVHIVHLSSSDALSPLFHARSARLPITVETCPHYLSFVAEEIADGRTAFKCAPPIRERENREFLWAALAGGVIQMVVSDHSQAPATLKTAPSRTFARAGTGISSLQLSLPATWTEAAARGYTLSQVVDWMCRMPPRLAGLARKGAVEPGYDADLVIFDPDRRFTVETTMLQPGHTVTPYLGYSLRGVVERTYLRGQRICERGTTIARPQGRVIARTH